MKAKRVIRLELTEDEAGQLIAALKELDEAATAHDSALRVRQKFDISSFWWSSGAILKDALDALTGAK